MSYEINLKVTLPSCPLQIEGVFAGVGVYYRARHGRLQLWLNPEGLADYAWMSEGDRCENPTREAEIQDPAKHEDSVPFALYVIARVIQHLEEQAYAESVKQAEEAFVDDITHLRHS